MHAILFISISYCCIHYISTLVSRSKIWRKKFVYKLNIIISLFVLRRMIRGAKSCSVYGMRIRGTVGGLLFCRESEKNAVEHKCSH